MLIFVFIVLLRLATAELVLQNAVENSVARTAEWLIPFEQQLKFADETIESGSDAIMQELPEELAGLLRMLADPEQLASEAVEAAVAPGFRRLVWSQLPASMRNSLFRYERLRVTEVTIPHVSDGQLLIGMTVEYELPVLLPMARKPYVLRAGARERVWYGWP